MARFYWMSSAIVVILFAGSVVAQEENFPAPMASPEHKFLKQFVGEWEAENEATMVPGQPPQKFKSTMTGEMIGDFWAVTDIECDIFGQKFRGRGTFGYDSGKKKYIGTWTDSMTEFMWQYEGTVEGNKLVLNSEGPNPHDAGKMIKARDTWEFKGKDLLILTSEFEGPDGKMQKMMSATCKRKVKE